MALLGAALCALVTSVDASSFLHVHEQPEAQKVLKSEVKDTLLSELSGFENLGQLKEIEDLLRPMYAALPKREEGSLDSATVRYALHRYFVQRHGWYVAGLEQRGNSWNSSEPTTIMKDRTPSYIQSLFEEQLHGRGFGLHELAVFAATLSDLIHKEAVDALSSAYRGLGLSLDQPVARVWSALGIKAYLAVYLIGGGISIRSLAEFKALEKEMPEVYPNWLDTMLWVQDLRHGHDVARKSLRNPFVKHMDTFDETVSFMLELGHRYGSYQNLECQALKNKLVDMEYQGTGRVPLSRFYSGGLDGDWQFKESVDYLRNIGALDETDASRPSVVIPNYLTSQSNCLTSSSFYSVCCSDQCEPLRQHLEREILTPSALPARIAEVVSEMHSETVIAPRNLSAALLGRLEEIATLHGGQVPMHGRLFSQWLHHAYPRECPFPHVAGTTSPMSPDEWMAIHGIEKLEASEDEILKHGSMVLEEAVADESIEALPWTHTEELVAHHLHRSGGDDAGRVRSLLRLVAACAALLSFAGPLLRTCSAMLATRAAPQKDQCFV